MTSRTKTPACATPRSARRHSWLEILGQPWPICLGLAALVALVFWPVGRFEFVNYDDPDYVSANGHVQTGLKWDNVVWAFTTGHASNWHPVTWLSHMLDWQLFGNNPGPQHLVSAGLHALNAVLLFLVLRRMTGAHWPSALVAALFGLHPLRVESVAWISERKDVLSALFLLLTMAAYCRYVQARGPTAGCAARPGPDSPGPPGRKPGSGKKAAAPPAPKRGEAPPGRSRGRLWYGLALFCFALGLMSKPMLVTLPFCLLLLDYWPFERIRFPWPNQEATKPATDQAAFGRKAARLLLEKLPFLVLAFASSIVTFLVQRSAGAVSTSLPLAARLANALVSYVRYLGKTLWPENLSVLYPHPGHWPVWEVAGSSLVLAAILALVLFWGRRRPYLPVGWFWFLGTLVPVIGLVQVGMQSMADRYTYIPSIGLFLMVAWAGAEWAQRRPATRPLLVSGAIACLAASTRLTATQVGYWHDSISLFQRAIAVTQNNYLAYNNLGFDLSARGKFEQAKENYAKSLAINPRYPDALNNMGYALAGEKQFAQAIPYYEAALKISPAQPEIHNNLGNALSELGKLNEAIQQYLIVLDEKPDHADAHNNLGIALAMQGKLQEAEVHFRAALRARPNYASAHSNLGNALAALHQIPEAIREYEQSLQLNPKDAQAHNNLGNTLVEQGRLDEALDHYHQALLLNPNNPETEFNLAIVLLRQNRKTEAATHLQAALRLNPSNAEARRQLELLSSHP